MKEKVIFLIAFVLLTSTTTLHKYYVSVSDIVYAEEEQAIQITSKVFIDDIQDILKERYDEKVLFEEGNESKRGATLLEKYFLKKFKVKINGVSQQLQFLGKEYEDDMLICYMEVENVKDIQSIEIQNQVLFDLTEEQQNLIHMKVNAKKKSFALRSGNDKGMLNF